DCLSPFFCALRREASPPGGRAPTVISVRMKSASVQKLRLWLQARMVWGGFIQDRRLHADALLIRAQSRIRADGFSSAPTMIVLFKGV
ncbi:MAG: hypothetical protein AAB150_05770, partial [Pseudomonadota bacterium]